MADSLPARVLGVAARSQDYARGLWRRIAEPVRFLWSLSALISKAFSSLAGAISSILRIRGFFARISLPMFSPIPLLPAWLGRAGRTQEPEAEDELPRYGPSFLVRISATRKLAADVARRTHARAPKFLIPPLPVAVPREIATEPPGPTLGEGRGLGPTQADAPRKRAVPTGSKPSGPAIRIARPLFLPAVAAAAPLALPVARAARYVSEAASPFEGRHAAPQTRRGHVRGRTSDVAPLRRLGPRPIPPHELTPAESASVGIPRGGKGALRPGSPADLGATRMGAPTPEPAQPPLTSALQSAPDGKKLAHLDAAPGPRGSPMRHEGIQVSALSAIAHIEGGTAEILRYLSRTVGSEPCTLASALEVSLFPIREILARARLAEILPMATLATYSLVTAPSLEQAYAASSMAMIGAQAIESVRQALRSVGASALLSQPSWVIGSLGYRPTYGPLGATALRQTAVVGAPEPSLGTRSWKLGTPVIRPSLRTVTPESPRTLNVTLLSGEAQEEDLRDLERKISRILSDQIRRHYGTTRLQEAF